MLFKHYVLPLFNNKIDFIVQSKIFMDYIFMLITTVYVIPSLNRFLKTDVLACCYSFSPSLTMIYTPKNQFHQLGNVNISNK